MGKKQTPQTIKNLHKLFREYQRKSSDDWFAYEDDYYLGLSTGYERAADFLEEKYPDLKPKEEVEE